jgi:hypothetical protein
VTVRRSGGRWTLNAGAVQAGAYPAAHTVQMNRAEKDRLIEALDKRSKRA